MPQPKNTTLRILIPIIALGVAALVVVGSFKTSKPSAAPASSAAITSPVPNPQSITPTPQVLPTAQNTPTTPAIASETIPVSTSSASSAVSGTPTVSASVGADLSQPPAGPPANPAPTAVLGQLRPRPFPSGGDLVVGDVTRGSDQRSRVTLSLEGAGIRTLELSEHFVTIAEKDHLKVQSEHALATAGGGEITLRPFSALGIEVSVPGSTQLPQFIPLFDLVNGSPVWRPLDGAGPGALEAIIEDQSGQPVLRIERRYIIPNKSNDIRLTQRVENVSSAPLIVRWFQNGPVDLVSDSASYGGDRRHLRFGYLYPASRDPSRTPITLGEFDEGHSSLLGQRYVMPGEPAARYLDAQKWPTTKGLQSQYELAWFAMNNRYFGVAVHSLYSTPPGVTKPMGGVVPLSWMAALDRVVLDGGDGAQVIGTRMTSLAMSVPPAAVADFSHGIFAGPLSRNEIKAEPLLRSMLLDRLVIYNFGGPCGWCTFPAVTDFLLWVLNGLHDYVVFDWAIAIMLLVVIVRTALHPLTRMTQIKMGRFGKQMAAMGPKQKILQEKYASDPTKLQQETAKLWREEGISPAGFLGCLPSFAQTPVWIALSAILFFAVELRHQGAFFGVFQKIQGAGSPFWHFLGDLAEPDRFIFFGKTLFTAWLLGPINSLNLLPLLLGVMFYIQQTKFAPPPSAPQTPEQEMQMKIMKYMTIFVFPLMMYNAPAGLSLYFFVNTTLAIAESAWIRAHMNKHDMLNVDKMRAERIARNAARSKTGEAPPSGGIMGALQKYAANKQRETETRFGQERPKR